MKDNLYLIESAYLGYRFHGWQKQKESVKTVQKALDRVLKYLLKENAFKTLPASRTDTMVSARQHYCQLFTEEPIAQDLLTKLNACLPDDIEILSIRTIDQDFQVVAGADGKEYHYYFYSSEERFPFAAPFMTRVQDPLDIELMQKGAKLFEGQHNFMAFCFRPTPSKQFVRTIDRCEIVPNEELQANFFPPTSYCLQVEGEGFFRQQIRIMMGTLFRLGKHEINLEQIEIALKGQETRLGDIAPAHGLVLAKTHFNQLA